jgi:hypothetical protein
MTEYDRFIVRGFRLMGDWAYEARFFAPEAPGDEPTLVVLYSDAEHRGRPAGAGLEQLLNDLRDTGALNRDKPGA